MNQIIPPIEHPLSVDAHVTAQRPSCQCRGATMQEVSGNVKKVIHNQMGWWYYLSSGVTVRDIWVKNVS